MSDFTEALSNCTICPHNCNADRKNGFKGICGAGVLPKVSLVSIHNWEEPCISGTNGSGTIFFSNCNLKCVFCQNYKISQNNFGMEITIENLADIFLRQQEKGVHNINLVSPSHFILQIREAIITAKKKGLIIPVVYNTNSYENVESLKLLNGLIDVYLADIKYFDDKYAKEYSSAPHYFESASNAVLEMFGQVGKNVFNSDGIMTKGVLIRHLVLPGLYHDSQKILLWIKENLGDTVYVSLMNQYVPMFKALEIKAISRKLTSFEYQKAIDYFWEIGLKNGYMQKKASAKETFTPNFNLDGINHE